MMMKACSGEGKEGMDVRNSRPGSDMSIGVMRSVAEGGAQGVSAWRMGRRGYSQAGEELREAEGDAITGGDVQFSTCFLFIAWGCENGGADGGNRLEPRRDTEVGSQVAVRTRT